MVVLRPGGKHKQLPWILSTPDPGLSIGYLRHPSTWPILWIFLYYAHVYRPQNGRHHPNFKNLR